MKLDIVEISFKYIIKHKQYVLQIIYNAEFLNRNELKNVKDITPLVRQCANKQIQLAHFNPN